MKRMFVLAVLAAGCSHGFDRGRIQERLATEDRQVDNDAIRAALARKAQIRFPMSVGVVFLEDRRYAASGSTAFHFRDRDREALLAHADALRAKGIVSSLFVISPDFVEGDDLLHLRLAAAKHGADAVLVVKGAAEMDRYVDSLAILNLTIVGGFLVPASHRDARFAVRCALWDVGNEFLYLTADAEAIAKRAGPSFLIEDGPALNAAKEDALRDVEGELVRRFSSLAGS